MSDCDTGLTSTAYRRIGIHLLGLSTSNIIVIADSSLRDR